MTDPIHEQLSAFLDGELSAAESELLLKRVERDPDLKVLLERYVLAGEAMRATAVQARPSRDFSARVAAALDNDSAPGRMRHVAQWLKPVAGGAIAAGVAAVALVSFQLAPQEAVQTADRDATQNAGQGTQVIAASNANDAAAVAAQASSSSVNRTDSGYSYTVPMQDRRASPPIQIVNNGRLANFVVAHSEYSSPLGRRNVLTGLVAEDVQADQPVEQFIVEQLADGLSVPMPVAPAVSPPDRQSDEASRRMLSNSPR